jgi:hypothetical protein
MVISLGDVCFEDKSEYWTWANAPESVHLYFDIAPPEPECTAAIDCEGKSHPDVPGYWECQSESCVWVADQEPPPCCDIPWWIYLAIILVVLLGIVWWRIT